MAPFLLTVVAVVQSHQQQVCPLEQCGSQSFAWVSQGGFCMQRQATSQDGEFGPNHCAACCTLLRRWCGIWAGWGSGRLRNGLRHGVFHWRSLFGKPHLENLCKKHELQDLRSAGEERLHQPNLRAGCRATQVCHCGGGKKLLCGEGFPENGFPQQVPGSMTTRLDKSSQFRGFSRERPQFFSSKKTPLATVQLLVADCR